jgi:hypothetical protein
MNETRGLQGRKNMSKTNPALHHSRILQRVSETRASWSPQERRRRAADGRRRRLELLAMIRASQLESDELWAVGAPTLEDSLRISE